MVGTNILIKNIQIILWIIFLCYQNVDCDNTNYSLTCLQSVVSGGEYMLESKTETYTDENITWIGRPSCVIYTKKGDDSKALVYYGLMAQNLLPIQCYNSVKMQCINSMNFTNGTEQQHENGLLCCCMSDECNKNNPIYYAAVQSRFGSQLIPIFRFFFALLVVILLTLVFTVVEINLPKFIKTRGYEKKIVEEVSNTTDEKKGENQNKGLKRYLLSLEPTQQDPEAEQAEMQRIRKILEEEEDQKVPPPKEKEEKSNEKNKVKLLEKKPSEEKTRLAKVDEKSGDGKTKPKTVKKTPSVLKTEKEETKRSPKSKPSFLFKTKKSKKNKTQSEAYSPDPTQDEEVVPIPPKPAVRVLNNRVQGVSMNYENSSFSDLQ